MPLPPLLPEPDLASARALRDQARDMEDHLNQHMHRVVRGGDKWLYLARETLLPDQVDIEPYPRLTPQGNTAPHLDSSADHVMGQARSAISRLEDRATDFGLQNVLSSDSQTQCLLLGNPIKPVLTLPFEVTALGNGRWLMNSGTLVNGMGQQWPMPRRIWETERGFIVANIQVSYLGVINGGNAWDALVIGDMQIVQELTCLPMAYTATSPQTWTPGSYMVPFAFVRMRPGLSPLVRQLRSSGNLAVPSNKSGYFIP